MDGNIEITKSNSYFYTDSLSNDMVVYTGTSNQHMLFGNQSNATSHINVWFSNITFNRLANFSCNVTVGSNPTTGLSNYVTLQTNNDFALIGNNVTWPLDHGGPALYMRYSENSTSNASFIQSINRLGGTSNMLDMQIQASNLYIATGGNTANINVTFKPDGKVGVGISNPSEIMHIIGNTRQTGLIAMNSNQPIVFGSNMVIGNAARIGFNLTGNSNFLDIFGGATSTSTGRQIYFWIDSNQNGGVAGMATFGGGKVFLNTGSLGIGTSNPLSRFHINSNALCYTLYTNNVNSNGAGGILMGLEDGAGGAQIWNSSNGGYIKFGTSNTERLKIGVNGYIGIGVSNPVNLLHIHNVTSTTSNVIQMTNVGIGSNVTNGFQLGQDQIGNIYLWNQQTAFMQFATNNIERMRLTSTGALGIGITTPLTLIHMTSNTSNYITHTNTANATGVMFGLEESATGGGAVIWQKSNAHIKFGTNNIERIRMTSNGYMGIGTQIPASRLTVTGYDGTNDPMQYGLLQLIQNSAGAVAGFHSNMASISIIRTGNQIAGMGYSKAQNIFGFGLGTNSNIDFYPSNLSMNLSTGCIGINNLNPTSTIHALSNTYSFQFPANQAGCSMSLYNSAGTPGSILFGQGNSANNCATILFGYTAAGNKSNYLGLGCFNTDNTLTVTAAANVGIGTVSPVYKLDVNGSVNINKANTLNNKLLVLFDQGHLDSLATACNFYGFGVNGVTLRYQSGSQHAFYCLASNIMVIGAPGWTNVGIGTPSPTFTTDIWQQNSNTKMLRLTGDCYKNISRYDPTNDDFSQFSISSCNNVTAGAYKVIMRIGVTTSNNYGFIQMVNPAIGQPQLCLNPQHGNVGINTSNPAYALDVAGGIRASNEIISNGASSANHFRAILGNYGSFLRNDGVALYILNTNSGNQYGSYSNNRPFFYAFGSGTVTIASGAITALDTCSGPPSSGFVGINTSSPQEQLHVTGNIKTSGTIINTFGHLITTTTQVFNSTTGSFLFRSITGSNINTYTDLIYVLGCNLCVRGTIYGTNGTAGNGWALNMIDNAQAYKAIIVGSNNSLNNASEMGFTNVGNGNAANRMNLGLWGNPYIMNILANGNVGIGTTAPTNKLQVEGTGYFNGTLNINGNNSVYFNTWGGGWFMQDTTWIRAVGDKQIYTGGTIATNSRLGIGTSGPDRRLQVTDGGSGDWIVKYTNGSVNTYFCHNGGYGMNINSATTENYAIQCYNGTQDHFTLFNNGSMYIQGPIYIFNQGGNANLGISLFMNNQDGASYTVYQGGIDSWYGIGFRNKGDRVTRHIWDVRTGNYSMTGTLSTAAILSSGIIKANGNGTNGSCQLNIGGTGNTCGYVSFLNAAGTRMGYIGWQAATTNYISMQTENTFSGYEVSGHFLVDGNTGLGTASPSYRLDVSGEIRSISGNIRVSGNGGLVLETWSAGWFAQDNIYIRSYSDRTIYTGGNVQVGGYVLAAAGTWSGNAAGLYNSPNITVSSVTSSGGQSSFSSYHSLGLISVISASPTNANINNTYPYSLNGVYRADVPSGGDGWNLFIGNNNGTTKFSVTALGRLYCAADAYVGEAGYTVTTQNTCYLYGSGTNGGWANYTGNAGGGTYYGKHFQIKTGDVTGGGIWGDNPTVYGGDLTLQAGNLNFGGVNNGTAYVAGYGGNVKIKPGFAYVSTNGSANSRSVQSGQTIFYYANTNGQSIDTSYTEAMRINNVGNVGIGTASPQIKLDIFNGAIGLQATSPWDHWYVYHDESTVIQRAGGAELGMSFQVAAGVSGRYGAQSYVECMKMLPNGNVGIGTGAPNYAFQVQSAANTAGTAFTYAYIAANSSSTFIPNFGPTVRNYSAYFAGQVLIAELNIFSDKRIKNDIDYYKNNSNTLDILTKLKPCEFNYIDIVDKGSNRKFGFIAQDVEEVLQNCVSKVTDYIPNIYSIASIVNINDKEYTLSIPKINLDIVSGDSIKIYNNDKIEYFNIITVNEIINETFITVKSKEPIIKPFIIGKKIDDFRVIDYDHITTLSVAAIQELKKEVDDLKKENQLLKDMLSSIMIRLDKANI